MSWVVENAWCGVVFGGGGVAGIAWETGVLAGLSDAPDGISAAQMVDAADVVIGTSAGAVVAAQLATRCDIRELSPVGRNPAARASGRSRAREVVRLWS